jgi:hypothetical protein
MRERKKIYDLMEQFGIDRDYYEPGEIDPAIQNAMKRINERSGLLDDYNDGIIQMAEGTRTIQWYGRRRCLSGNNNLLHWIQQQDDLLIAQVCVRSHPETDEPTPYAEIHAAYRWGYGDD